MERAHIPRSLIGACRLFADWLIEYSVQSHFQAVFARVACPPAADRSTILFANHHYWWDGYLCYILGKKWRMPMTLWMEDWRWFPPFWALGALPYPTGNVYARAHTLRQTLRLLQHPPRVLFLFPEGTIHADPELLPFGRSLYWLTQHVPNVQVLPMAIAITHTRHQYPRAFMAVEQPLVLQTDPSQWLKQAQDIVYTMLYTLREEADRCDTFAKAAQAGFQLLVQGKPSIHERRWVKYMP